MPARKPNQAVRPASAPKGPASGELTVLYISVASGFFMAAITARNFGLPLRAMQLGATKSEVGLLLGVLVFTGGFVALTGGAAGDYIGRRRTILGGIAISAIAQISLCLSTSVLLMYPIQVAGGIGLGTTQATLFAAAADAATPGRLGRAMGILTLGIQVGILSGPGGAGLALLKFNLQQVIALAASLYLVAFFIVLFGLARVSTRRRSRDVARDVLATVGQWTFLTATMATFALSMMWNTVLSFAPLIGKEFLHLPIQQVGLLVAGLGVVSALFAVPAGRLVDRVRDKQALLAATAIVVSCLVIAFGHSSGPTAGTTVLIIAVLFATVSGFSAGLSHFGLASSPARGVAMGLLLTTQNFAGGIGAATFGLMLQHLGYEKGLSALGASAIGLILLAVFLRYAKSWIISPPVASR